MRVDPDTKRFYRRRAAEDTTGWILLTLAFLCALGLWLYCAGVMLVGLVRPIPTSRALACVIGTVISFLAGAMLWAMSDMKRRSALHWWRALRGEDLSGPTIQFTRADGEPLGTPESISGAVVKAVPGAQFNRYPAGAERLALLKASGQRVPRLVRKMLADEPRSVIKGDYRRKEDGLWLQFFPHRDLCCLEVLVTGDLAVVESMLNRLASEQGWEMHTYGK